MASWAGERRCCVLVFLWVAFMVMVRPSMQAAAPAPAPDCLTVVFGLTDCLTYVEGNVTTPAPACCTELSPVIKTTPQCLCTLFNTTLTASFGITINTTLALQLPAACKLTTPPVSQCAALGFPVPGPVGSTPPVVSPSSATPSSSKAPTPSSKAPTPSSKAPTPSSSAPTPSSMAPTAPSSGPSAPVTPAPASSSVESPTPSSTAPGSVSSSTSSPGSSATPPALSPSSAPRLTLPGVVGGSLLLFASLLVQ